MQQLYRRVCSTLNILHDLSSNRRKPGWFLSLEQKFLFSTKGPIRKSNALQIWISLISIKVKLIRQRSALHLECKNVGENPTVNSHWDKFMPILCEESCYSIIITLHFHCKNKRLLFNGKNKIYVDVKCILDFDSKRLGVIPLHINFSSLNSKHCTEDARIAILLLSIMKRGVSPSLGYEPSSLI